MQTFNSPLKLGAAALMLIGSGGALAFSFSIDDDDGYYPPYPVAPYGQGVPYGAPGWGAPPNWGQPPVAFQPWVTPPQQFWYPRLPHYDRLKMTQGRQRQMSNFDDAMNELRGMLYGNADFDRTRAIQIARKIEATSGHAITGNFHPGAVATLGSHTSPALWGNQEAFQGNAEALKAAADALAEELAKRPSDQEGAIYLGKRSERFGSANQSAAEPVSPQIWKKFNLLSDTCVACHSSFRGPGW